MTEKKRKVEEANLSKTFNVSSENIEILWEKILDWLRKIHAKITDSNKYRSIQAEHGSLEKIDYKNAFKTIKISIKDENIENNTFNLSVSLDYIALSTQGPEPGNLPVRWFTKELLDELK
jgi:hypothetical protein